MTNQAMDTPLIQASEEADEDALLNGLAVGNGGVRGTLPKVFAALYRRYLPRVYRYFFFRVGDRFEAEELTSQTFLAALEGLPGYRHRGHFGAWLFGIARRKAASHQRRLKVPAPLEAVLEGIEAGGDLAGDRAEDLTDRERMERLVAALAGLKEVEQELLRLRFAARLSFNEMGVLLQRSPGSLKMEIYHLLRRLEVQASEY